MPRKAAAKAGDKSKKPTQVAPDAKAEVLEGAITDIKKRFGAGAIMKMGEKPGNANLPVVTTGILSIDAALGVGGIPKGRIVEVYGPESSGKTTLALHVVAESQKLGGIVGYVDAEHAMDPKYAKKLGVNTDELYISQPDDGEQALEIAEAMVRSGAIDVVVVDSVAALVPRSEIEGEMGASSMGVQARLMSQALRKLTGITAKTNCIVIFINQLRDKIGVQFGSPETTTGGRALKFYASIRVDIRRGDFLKGPNDTILGNRTKIKITKNKVSPPFKNCEVDLLYGEGLSKLGDLLDIGVTLGLITKSGSWFSCRETRLGQGREKAREYLADNPKLVLELENAARAHFGFKSLEELAGADNFIAVNPEELAKYVPPPPAAAEPDEIILDDVDFGA